MEHDDYDNWEPGDNDSEDSLDEDRSMEPQPKRRRLNPGKRISRPRGGLKNKRLPAKLAKEMTLRKAKRLIYGARAAGRPSRNLSSQIREARRVLQVAGLPTKKQKDRVSTRGRGRPKKPPVLKEKKPRGRPKKTPAATAKPKRPRGRPKLAAPVTTKLKRPRGRPKKNPLQQLSESIKKRIPKKED